MTPNGKSATRLWIVIGMASVILMVGFVVGIGMKISTTLSAVMGRTDKPASVALHFAEALRTQSYGVAFADLDINARFNGQVLEQDAFIKMAQDADSERGSVLFYGLLPDENDSAQFSIKLQRGNQSYTIHVRLQPVSNGWKIGSIDSL